jgi:hypothetical protein
MNNGTREEPSPQSVESGSINNPILPTIINPDHLAD